MKNYYVLKNENESLIFEQKDYALVMEKLKQDSTYRLKGFYEKEKADEYSKIPVEKVFFVFKSKTESVCFSNKNDLEYFIKDKIDFFILTAKNESRVTYLLKTNFETIKNEKQKKEIKKEQKERKAKKEYKQINKILLSIKEDFVAFIDCEASDNKAISIGLVIYDIKNNKVVDTFYSLLCPKYFEQINPFVEKLTHLTTNDILNAPKVPFVINELNVLLKRYNICKIFSWGEADKKFINSLANECNVKIVSEKMYNIQRTISLIAFHITGNKQLSLSNMKKLYGINVLETSHNALDDAIDLTNIFDCWWNNVDIDNNSEYDTKKCANE